MTEHEVRAHHEHGVLLVAKWRRVTGAREAAR
jgi:hypothetical protein